MEVAQSWRLLSHGSYLVMEVTQSWRLFSHGGYLVMEVAQSWRLLSHGSCLVMEVAQSWRLLSHGYIVTKINILFCVPAVVTLNLHSYIPLLALLLLQVLLQSQVQERVLPNPVSIKKQTLVHTKSNGVLEQDVYKLDFFRHQIICHSQLMVHTNTTH